MSREKFEALPEIKSRLEFCYWSDDDDCYRSKIAKEFAVYLNGAYYAFCEQEKMIDAALNEVKNALKCCESTETECVLLEIQELLK